MRTLSSPVTSPTDATEANSQTRTPREIACFGCARTEAPVHREIAFCGRSCRLLDLHRSAKVESATSCHVSTTMISPTGLRSPSNPRSAAPSPRPSFDSDLLRAYMKKLLQSTLQTATWPPARERDKVKSWMKELGERVKERMIGALARLCSQDACLH